MRKIKRISKFEGLEPRRCEDIKGIVVLDIGPKSFGTFEKQASGKRLWPQIYMCGVIHISVEGNLVCIAGKRTENTAILWSTPL